MVNPAEDPKKPASHRTAVFILVAMFVGTAYFGWQVYRTSRLSIVAVSKPAEFRLKASREHPTAFWIRISGWIDGQGQVEIAGRPPELLDAGNVQWRLKGDWTEPECVLKYTPKGATMGRLEVEYRID